MTDIKDPMAVTYSSPKKLVGIPEGDTPASPKLVKVGELILEDCEGSPTHEASEGSKYETIEKAQMMDTKTRVD
jgi:hypothetical protein